MKKVFITLGILVSIAAQIVFAQTEEGVITFETKVNIHRTLPPDRQEMRTIIPEFRTSKAGLFFNSNESLYKPMENEEEDEEIGNGGMVRMRYQTMLNEVYVNQYLSKKVLRQEFMGKKYLIEDTLNLIPWKFSEDTKEILGYTCKQASFYHEERKQNIVAWYTDKLRPFLGPESFNTLPGAVLQVDINEGERVVTALNIELRSLKKNELKVPSSGAKITGKEYRQMVEEQRIRTNADNIIIR
ncbi:GLPGLI family protein [Chryseosolibacter indicus]|uniref:GLPGLI family protein n=1 Tax=Chryseosolibacter indicus TaxID=2782351 RepID=A0ABS5VYW6_9BACT|nr:GLPGLI family protein [Chryseosolibacter indicus]MBT1706055.1 GLPGLI family protein [Chryseosolibacter indicus]